MGIFGGQEIFGFDPFQIRPDGGVLAIDAGARIDLSGTTDTTVGVDRYFVTTELLGSNDLKDAPLQKSGLLYRNKVTLDVRAASDILGDLGCDYAQGWLFGRPVPMEQIVADAWGRAALSRS